MPGFNAIGTGPIGTSTAAGPLAAILAGAAVAFASAAGALTATGPASALSGSAACVASASGALSAPPAIVLAGSAACVASAAGTLTAPLAPAALSGSAACLASAAGNLATPRALAGSAACVASAAGFIVTPTPAAVLGGAASASASASAALADPAYPLNPDYVYVTRRARRGARWDFPDMFAGDVETLALDFSDTLPSGARITSATAHFVVHIGADPTPNALIVGGPLVAGPYVVMRVAPQLPGVAYYPRVTATYSDGQRVTLPEHGDGSLRVFA